MSGVDVLATLEHAFISLRIDGRVTESDQVDLARAAVAELIEVADNLVRVLRGEGGTKPNAYDDLLAALSRVRGA